MVYRQHLENLWCLFYKETNPKPLQPSYFLKLLLRLSYGGVDFQYMRGSGRKQAGYRHPS